MSNVNLLQHINTLHEDFLQGDIDLEAFGSGLKGCVEAMESGDFYKHEKRGVYIAHPTWAADGNVHDRRIDENWLLAEFRDWLGEMTRFIQQQSPA